MATLLIPPPGWIDPHDWTLPPQQPGIYVTNFGADPTGQADSTVAIQSAFNDVPGTGGFVYFPAGTYLVSATTFPTWNTVVAGTGPGTVITFTGTGDCFRMQNPTIPSGAYNVIPALSGGFRDLLIDGTLSGAGSAGIHMGDGLGYNLFHVMIHNFAGAGSIGLHLDNNIWWTEKLLALQVEIANCTSGVVVDVTGTGTNSFEYNHLEAHVYCNAGQAGFTFQNGAQWNGMGGLYLSGNMQNASGPFLTITGTDSGAHGSKIYDCPLWMRAEVGVGGSPPVTVSFGTLGGTNLIQQTSGQMLFSGTWTATNGTSGNLDTVRGRIFGDSTLLGLQALQTVTTPGFPATTVTVTNTTPGGIYAYINPQGASITACSVNGSGIGFGTFSSLFTVFLSAGGTFVATYTGGPPTWQWRRVCEQ